MQTHHSWLLQDSGTKIMITFGTFHDLTITTIIMKMGIGLLFEECVWELRCCVFLFYQLCCCFLWTSLVPLLCFVFEWEPFNLSTLCKPSWASISLGVSRCIVEVMRWIILMMILKIWGLNAKDMWFGENKKRKILEFIPESTNQSINNQNIRLNFYIIIIADDLTVVSNLDIKNYNFSINFISLSYFLSYKNNI